jgi:hypothetical protein
LQGWHNGPVIRRERRLLTVPVLFVAAALSLSAWGGSTRSTADDTTSTSTSPSVSPTPSVPVPSGVTLTEAGSKLSFGQTATVPYEPNDKRATVLALTVTGATRASLKDFSAYVLDKRTKASTPYYVHVKVKNVGSGDVGGTDVPLWAVNQQNVLIHSSSFTNSFTKCPSPTLPAHFGPSATLNTCLVYLVPDGGTMTSVSFRPLQAFDPIVWTGTIKQPATHGKKGHHKTGKKKS